MLNILRQIVHEVNEAQDLQEVLAIMVERISTSLQAEACSVYLADRAHEHYRLIASVGFHEGVDGKVILGFSEGLVGLVGEREEPINLERAQTHPQYRYFPETGEERYQAFLGVPIIHQRKLVGILVVQQCEARRFDEDEVAFLVTVSLQLAGLIAHAQTAGMITELWPEETLPNTGQNTEPSSTILYGAPASGGVAIGHAVVSYATADLEGIPDRTITDITAEIDRFLKALNDTRIEMLNLSKRLHKLPLAEQSLFDAYVSILDSKMLQDEIIALINLGHWAPWALKKIIKMHVREFELMEDAYLRERSADLLDLGQRILSHLQSEEFNPTASRQFPENTILICDDLSAARLAEVPKGRLRGVISARGSANSHVAILARALGIPAIMGVMGLPTYKLELSPLIIDGHKGEVYLDPTEAMINEFGWLAKKEEALYAGLEELRDLKAQTKDGVRIELCVNSGLTADLQTSLEVGAEGVGLYRTEVPFMIRDRFPSEEEQYEIYREILSSFAPKPVTIRTLDVGGDKPLPYFPVEENNPFLGWRGIRVTLDHPEIFLPQLRAMLRASRGLNNLKILLPMISCVSEVDESVQLIHEAYQEVSAEADQEQAGELQFPPIGVMIEVPSVIFQIRAITQRVDFLSVGSNDLTQYLLAVDRSNTQVANLYDCLHPAVLRALSIAVKSAQVQNKKISICGEMAGDPVAVIALLGLGFDMLSMNAGSLPPIKWVIRNFTIKRAQVLLSEVLLMDNAKDVRLHLTRALEDVGLGGLVRGTTATQ